VPATVSRGRPALALLLVLGVLWGATFPISRLGVESGANPFLLVAIAFGLAAVASAPLAVARRAGMPSGRSLLQSAGIGALLIAGINLPLYWGERFATGGAASVVYATAPILSLGFALALGTGIRIGRRGVFALLLGVAGVAVLAVASGSAAVTSVWGLAAFGLGATCQAAGAVTLGRVRPRGETPWGATFQFLGGGIAALVVMAAIDPTLALPATPAVVGSILYVGLISMAVGYAIFFELIRRQGAVGANQVTFLNPVVALALGVLAFGEPFALEEVGGLALILLAVALLHLPEPPATRDDGAAGTRVPSEVVGRGRTPS
jgi:drug/metabolite transporter (DMT)-like permease